MEKTYALLAIFFLLHSYFARLHEADFSSLQRDSLACVVRDPKPKAAHRAHCSTQDSNGARSFRWSKATPSYSPLPFVIILCVCGVWVSPSVSQFQWHICYGRLQTVARW